MWLIYYVKNGNKGWLLGESREKLQKWADENLDVSEMSGDDEYEIVDLARSDLVSKIFEANKKLEMIKDIVNNRLV